MSLQAADLIVDPGENSSAHCACCGQITRCISGSIATREACIAA